MAPTVAASSSASAAKSILRDLLDRTKAQMDKMGEDTSNITPDELESLTKAMEKQFDAKSLFLWTELNEKADVRAWIKSQKDKLQVSGSTWGLCLMAYDVAVKEKVAGTKAHDDLKNQEKVKLSEADVLQMNENMGVGVAVPGNMFANHEKLQKIHNDFLIHRCPLEKIDRWATYDDIKSEEPLKKQSPAFNIAGVDTIFQAGETEEAMVKRMAIKVTHPSIYLHALLCLMHTYAIAGSFKGDDGGSSPARCSYSSIMGLR